MLVEGLYCQAQEFGLIENRQLLKVVESYKYVSCKYQLLYFLL